MRIHIGILPQRVLHEHHVAVLIHRRERAAARRSGTACAALPHHSLRPDVAALLRTETSQAIKRLQPQPQRVLVHPQLFRNLPHRSVQVLGVERERETLRRIRNGTHRPCKVVAEHERDVVLNEPDPVRVEHLQELIGATQRRMRRIDKLLSGSRHLRGKLARNVRRHLPCLHRREDETPHLILPQLVHPRLTHHLIEGLCRQQGGTLSRSVTDLTASGPHKVLSVRQHRIALTAACSLQDRSLSVDHWHHRRELAANRRLVVLAELCHTRQLLRQATRARQSPRRLRRSERHTDTHTARRERLPETLPVTDSEHMVDVLCWHV